MVDPIRTSVRTSHDLHEAGALDARMPTPGSTPLRPGGPVHARDRFDSDPTARCVIRRGVFADSAPTPDCRGGLQDLIARLHAQPLPPTALERLPRAPEGPMETLDRRHEADFHEGMAATVHAGVGSLGGAVLGATSLGHEGHVLAASVATVYSAGHQIANGANPVVAAARAQGSYLLELGVHHIAGAAGGVAFAGAELLAESVIGGLETGDAVRDAATARSHWDHAREAAGRAATAGQRDGYHAAMQADLSQPGLPSSIDAHRFATDGDYARATLATLEWRLAHGRY